MNETEVLLQRTSKAAIRLLKSRLREYLYKTKRDAADLDDTQWSAMLLVEHTFSGPADREWKETLKLWGNWESEVKIQSLLYAIVSRSFSHAASEVLSIFEAEEMWAMKKLIEQYHRTFKPESFLDFSGALVSDRG